MEATARSILRALSQQDATLMFDGAGKLVLTAPQDADLQSVLGLARERKAALIEGLQAFARDMPDAAMLHALPTDRRRSPTAARSKGIVVVRLESDLQGALAALAMQCQHPVDEMLATLMAAFLSRYSGESSVALGCWQPSSSDAEAGLSLLQYTLTDDMTVAELLGERTILSRVAELQTTACVWSRLHEQGYHPYFQILLSFEPEDELIGARQYRRSEQLDLNIHVRRYDGGCDFGWEYETALFSQRTVLRMAENFACFLRHALQRPGSSYRALPMISALEQRALAMVEPTREPFDDAATIHALFERQVQRTPDAIAVVHGTHQVTYRQLDRAASRLAHRLRQLGVQGEQFVGVYMGRSPALVCSILAVLKAGAAYLPLDPTYPAERIAYLLDDASVATVITQASLASRFADADYRVFQWQSDELDTLDSAALRAISDADAEASRCVVDHRRLAYAIYTSGSTGQPKGVMIEHRNTVCFLRWAHATFSPEVMANVLASTSMNFDLSVFEFFAPLSCGGRLTIVDSLLDLIGAPGQYEGITLINSVPSAVNELVLSGKIPDSVRVVNLAGEPLRRALVDNIYASSKVERVYNLYGPSEDTTYSTYTLAERGVDEEPSIGRPLPHTQAYILDDRLVPVPIGVVGELYLGGASLSRGYLNKPELTQKVFIANPFHDAAKGEPEIYARLYKTGDRARWSPSGQIEFMGRVDHQVKIRGFRIELGEIEARLLKLPNVRECVVVVHKVADADQRIVAYVAPHDSAVSETAFRDDLKAGLSEFLPSYMIPASFMVLKALPLLPNGKVNRKALPEPVYGSVLQTGELQTPTQRRLAELWTSVLGGGAVPSAQASFFELGGHSLLLTKLINAVYRAFGVRLSFGEAYENPGLGQMAEAIDRACAAHKAQVTEPLVREAPPAASGAGEPLSYSQQQLWFIDQLQGASPQYHLQLNFDIRGPLDLACLERAQRRLLQRHEALRTNYRAVDGEPRQFVNELAEPDLVSVDVSQAGDAREARLREVLDEALSRPIVLARDSMLRVVAIKLDDEHHHLALVVHHIAADGWSLELLKRDLSAFYAIEQGAAVTEPDPTPWQYRDFARWQRHQSPAGFLPDLTYWKQQLSGIPALHGLPSDRERPPEQRYRGAVWRQIIPSASLDGLRRLCLQANTTLFVGLHALFAAMIHRLSGDQDIVIGTPVAGRHDDEFASVVGFFVNTLALRCEVSAADSFADLLRRSRGVVVDAFDHQTLSFAQLTEALAPQRSLSHSPIFQIMLSLQNNERHALTLAGAQVCEVPPKVFSTCMFDLLLDIAEFEDGAHLAWEYDCDLFDERTIRDIAVGFESLLGGVVARPHDAIAAFTLPGAIEQDRLIRQWNDTDTGFDETDLLHRGFERQAARTPDAIAVICRGASLSYRELDTRADALAAGLRRAGVNPGDFVGVHLHRSLDMVVSILAVLKAGAAYVPLDTKYPEARLRYMIEDSARHFAISHRSVSSRLEDCGVHCIVIDDTADSYRDGDVVLSAGTGEPTSPITTGEGDANAGDLAYVIYTSGSTGTPKGVMIEHRNAVCFLAWVRQVYGARELRSVLACTSICFDLSVFELFAPLHAGGRIVLVDSVLDLLDASPDVDVSLINCVPSAMAELVEHGAIPASVVTVNLAGEPLRRRLVDAIYARSNVEAVYNLYGPSEDTTYSTYCRVERDSTAEPSIGRPISNTRAYVLDSKLQLCPIGSIGELYLGGGCLARGYLNQPALTAAAFIDSPLLTREGHGDIGGRYRRLYRTGDLVRLRPDGELEFVGRVDHQVKLRGFRIELGEIEVALSQHPDVEQSVVIVDEQGAEDRRLVGYVATRQSPENHAALQRDLKAHLRSRLPHYMQPAAIVILQALPLTPNGKVDRTKLPRAAYASEGRSRTPETAVEKALAGLWCDVLKRDAASLGRSDNFFALGGHSLLLTRLINAVNQRFDVRLSMKDVYEAEDLADMARRIEQARGTGDQMPRADRDATLPLSYSQLRVWFVEQLDPGTNQNNIQVGVRLDGEVSVEHLQRSLDQIVASHDVFRIQLSQTSGEPAQRVLPGPLAVPIDYRDLSDGEGDIESAARELLNTHGTQVFDLFRAPLLSVMLLKLSARCFRLNIVVHHLIFDGISFNAFLSELLARYDASRAGRAYAATRAPFDYPDYVLWQRHWLHSVQAGQQEAFWREYLAQPFERIRLPSPVDETVHPPSSFLSIALERDLRDRLTLVAQRHQGTLFNVMHAAFCLLLGRLSGSRHVCTGIPVAGRNLAYTDRVYGNFLNNLPVRASIDLRESFDVYLRRQVKDMAQVLANQDLPFERIVELNPRAREDATPLFNVFFNMLGEDAEATRTGDFELHADDVGIVDTKFDLTLYVLAGATDWNVHCHFRTAFATPSMMARMLRQYLHLLRGIAAQCELPCGAFDLDAAKEAADSGGPAPSARSGRDVRPYWPGPVHALFERMASRYPDKTAVIGADADYSYRWLRDASAGFAARLSQAGVAPGARVAVLATRSVDLVVAVFATLRTGAAFSLINPDQPIERLLQLLDILQPAGVVFCGLPDAFDAVRRDRVASRWRCVYTQAEPLAATPVPAVLDVDPQQPACITFTSGTSGVPKAVVGTHIGLSGYLEWWPATMGVGADDRYSLLSGLGHDPIQRDIFGALCTGATLVIPDEAEVIPGRLAAWFARHRISVAHLTPAMSQILCDTGETLPALKLVFLTGEKLHSDRVYAIKRLNPSVVVLNSYGTTETQRGSTYFVASSLTTYRGAVPVGRATPDTRLRILNECGHECGLGEVGEIYLESYHLSNGYLDDPAGTERVLSIGQDGLKRYRTGDYGCYLSDALVRCLGRNDRQINIRGYRADLSEIESACRRDTAVKDAVVVATMPSADSDAIRLIAYVVTDTPSAAFDERVMAQLVETLPSYLVPTAVLSLSALPLTSNGKLDERRLPVPDLASTRDAADLRTETERMLARIWQDVLGRERVGACDNFFALGGHSLLALKMSGLVWQAFGVSLPLKALFERPTVRAIADYVAQHRGTRDGVTRSHPERTGQTVAPLSFAQQRIYFLSQFPDQQSLFNLPRAFAVQGELDIAALRGALRRLVQRHSSLRTMFVADDGEVVQRIDANADVELAIVDLSMLDEPARRERMDRLVDDEALVAFDLAADTKLRAKLIINGSRDYVLLLTAHHIASDGWSNSLLLSELSRDYADTCLHRAVDDDTGGTAQYIDYSIWQRERHQLGQLDDSLAYWREQLADLPALHSLPLDRERPVRQVFAGAHFETHIAADVADALRRLCGETGATLFMVLNAAWSVVLSRFGGASDIVIGTPVAGRDVPGLEGAVGCFINNLVLRFDVRGDRSFLQYLDQVKRTTLDAFAHADVPFELLVEALNPARTQSHTPLFQIMLALQSYDRQPLTLHGADCRPRAQAYPCSKFDLSLYCWEDAHGIDLLWEYATALFDRATIEAMSRAFAVVLESIVRDPAAPLDRFALIDGAQRERLLRLAAGPSTPSGLGPVHVLFQAQCARAPERTAVVASDGALSYGELNRRANRIARFLKARVRRQAPVVGVCLDRSTSLPATLLGVMKAGGCYVPLDPMQPGARLRAMVSQADVDAIVTEQGYADRFAAGETPAAVIAIDDPAVTEAIAAAGCDDLPRSPADDALAYVIFTSGSTGTPKGVAIGHAALSNLLLSMAEAPGIDSGDRLLAVTSIGFDIAGLELFLPLIAGAQVHLADAVMCKDANRLAACLDERAITVMQATPSMWQLLLDSGALGGRSLALKILVGGEMLGEALANRLCALGSAVWNLYGPTETTIWSTRWQCRAGERVSIGRPIDNTECYVLSAGAQLQPPGAVGELYIGGDGLAAGYYRQPDLTAKSFVPNPFRPGRLLYRTGDLCRQTEDGRLFCLGRRDQQIKIRGFRVELGEIEAALLRCEGIAACVVSLAATPSGDDCLVAHATTTDAAFNASLSTEASAASDERARRVLAQVREMLPDYMVPSAIMFLARMPLNANGKIDRAALPKIALARGGTAHVAPQTSVERKLAKLWSEWLRIEDIGVTENFFGLGGHSIMAMKLLARINGEYGLSIPLLDFLEVPTIRALGSRIELLGYLRQSQPALDEGGGRVESGREFIL